MKLLLLMMLPWLLETYALAGDSIHLPPIDGITDLKPNRQTKALKEYAEHYQTVAKMDLNALHLGDYVLTSGNSDEQTRYTCPQKFSIQLDEFTSYIDYHAFFSDNRPYSLYNLGMGLVSPRVIKKGKEIDLYCECTDTEDTMAMGISIAGAVFSFLPLQKTRIKWSENEVEFKVIWRVNVLWGALATRGDVERALINFGPNKKDLRITYDRWDSTIFNIKKKKYSKHFVCGYELVQGSDTITPIHLPSLQSLKDVVQNGYCRNEFKDFAEASKDSKHNSMKKLVSCVKQY